MDVVAIRLANLNALVEALMQGGRRTQKDAATDLDMSPSYLNQLIRGKKMGDEVARKIEAARNLPHGWLDREHHGVSENNSDVAYQALRIDPDTIAASLRLIRLSFDNLGLQFDSEADGTPLAFAYEYLLVRGDRSVTPDNLIDFSRKLAERLRGKDAEQVQTRDTGSPGGGHRRAS